MKLLLVDTPQGHSSFRFEEDAESLDLLTRAPVRGAVVVEGDADRMGDQITLRATVAATAVADCGRCTEPVTQELHGEFLVVSDLRGSDSRKDEAALEEEGSILYHDGLEIPLTGTVREAVILEEPQVILCKEDCRGLCPVCGINRNRETCSCKSKSTDARWDALEQMDPKSK